MPTVESLLSEGRARLERADVGEAKLDARLLLQYAAGLRHDEIIADPSRNIDETVAREYAQLVMKRTKREPLSRILGKREFYGRSFDITPAVLDPRPDSETLIEAALLLPPPSRILDLGTGSGILAITLLCAFEQATAVALDVSEEALAVARANAARLGVGERLTLLHSNWFEHVAGRFDLIVSNPPYIPAHEIPTLEPEVRSHDPELALNGGADGLSPYRQIAAGAAAHMMPNGQLMVEIGAGQATDVTGIFTAQGFLPQGHWQDLGGHVRVLAFQGP